MLAFAVQNATKTLRLTRAKGIAARTLYTSAGSNKANKSQNGCWHGRGIQTATKWRPVQVLDEYVSRVDDTFLSLKAYTKLITSFPRQMGGQRGPTNLSAPAHGIWSPADRITAYIIGQLRTNGAPNPDRAPHPGHATTAIRCGYKPTYQRCLRLILHSIRYVPESERDKDARR